MGSDSLTPAERARATLLEHLSPRQRAEFERIGSFKVRGNWGRRYCIYPYGDTARIRGRALVFWSVRFNIWCAPRSYLVYDDMLALKLLAETDEHRLREIACYLYV